MQSILIVFFKKFAKQNDTDLRKLNSVYVNDMHKIMLITISVSLSYI